MNFNEHSKLKGQHAFLSASKYHWINYDRDKLVESFYNHNAIQKGTELHEFAAQCIRLRQKLPKSKKTLNQFVNDSIGFKMNPEQVLYYSDNCFGTADAISFRKSELRIHDLKTGVTPAHMEQLEVYMALFCHEYRVSPYEIFAELRIYQMNDVLVYNPDPDRIKEIMDKIVEFDRLIKNIKFQEGLV